MSGWLLLTAYYFAAAALVAFVIWFYRLINQPGFRDQLGDVSTEVGYEEDSCGNVIPYARDDFSHAHQEPHVNATGNMGSGPM